MLASLALLVGCEEVNARRAIQEGNKLYYAGKYEQAIEVYDRALKVHPELAVGWFNKGLAHLALFAPGGQSEDNEKHTDGAIESFTRYLAAIPTEDPQARDYLLSTYIDSGRYEGALQYFEGKLKVNPGDVQAVAQLALINTQAGRFDEANRWHRKRVDVETTAGAKADAWYSIGVLNWRRLHYGAQIVGAERARLADEGLAALRQADQLRRDHQPTITYVNLLYRERALAHDAFCARIVDLANAQVYYKRAVAMAKAAQAGAPRNGSQPEQAAAPEQK